DQINRLASKMNLGITLEDPAQAAELDRQLKFPVDAYIKIDTGYHRTGLSPDEMPVITGLVEHIHRSSMIRLKGLLTHAGHSYHAKSPEEIIGVYRSSVSILQAVRDNLGDTDRKLILSYGDTPSCSIVDSFEGIDEIRPGNFVFYDLMQMVAGVCDFSQIAGIVVCPVVAVHPRRNQAVLYGGAIHFSKESIRLNAKNLYGQMVEMDESGWYKPIADAYLVSLTQEHGVLEAPEAIIKRLKPGAVIGIIPVHSCLTANLIHRYQLLSGGHADYLPE
ncbi:MAG: alanine racemase, partial [Bacteroidales bacterium]|nr:alanine racemase [Bacteroidales bacterium]